MYISIAVTLKRKWQLSFVFLVWWVFCFVCLLVGWFILKVGSFFAILLVFFLFFFKVPPLPLQRSRGEGWSFDPSQSPKGNQLYPRSPPVSAFFSPLYMGTCCSVPPASFSQSRRKMNSRPSSQVQFRSIDQPTKRAAVEYNLHSPSKVGV